MSRYIFATILLALFGYYSYSVYQSRVSAAETRAENRRQEARIDAAIKTMAAKDNADTTWATTLSQGDSVSFNAPLTAALQQAWIIGRPILFEGKLSDVARNDDGTYQILVEYTPDNDRPLLLSGVLQLRLDCPASVGAAQMKWLQANPATFYNKVAVTGIVQRIESTIAKVEGISTPVQVGRGECIGIIPIPEELRG